MGRVRVVGASLSTSGCHMDPNELPMLALKLTEGPQGARRGILYADGEVLEDPNANDPGRSRATLMREWRKRQKQKEAEAAAEAAAAGAAVVSAAGADGGGANGSSAAAAAAAAAAGSGSGSGSSSGEVIALESSELARLWCEEELVRSLAEL